MGSWWLCSLCKQATKVVTWLATLHFTSYGARCIVRSIDWSYQALAPISLSWLYSFYCSGGEQTPNLFILKVHEGWESEIKTLNVLCMTLNCIWWCGASSEALGNVEYPFIVITPKFILLSMVVPVRVPSIELFDHLLSIIIINSYLKPYGCMFVVCIV